MWSPNEGRGVEDTATKKHSRAKDWEELPEELEVEEAKMKGHNLVWIVIYCYMLEFKASIWSDDQSTTQAQRIKWAFHDLNGPSPLQTVILWIF